VYEMLWTVLVRWPMLNSETRQSQPGPVRVPRVGTSAPPQSDVSSVLIALRLSGNEPFFGHAWIHTSTLRSV
jgi:hypothetical protein